MSRVSVVAVVALVVLAGASFLAWQDIHNLATDIRTSISLFFHKQELLKMQTFTNSWLSNGETVTVTTVRNIGESLADFEARHEAAVNARKQSYPPDPQAK